MCRPEPTTLLRSGPASALATEATNAARRAVGRLVDGANAAIPLSGAAGELLDAGMIHPCGIPALLELSLRLRRIRVTASGGSTQEPGCLWRMRLLGC